MLAGGAGDDTYVVGAGDTVTDALNGGTDTVNSSVSITLGANVENLVLTTDSGDIGGTGNGLANVITGNGGNNALSGAGGDDVVNGGAGSDNIDGGTGNDTITGGTGDDVMTGGAGNDLLVVAAGFGNDVVNSFDANPAGGQDLLDVTAYQLTETSFADAVSILQSGADTVVHIGADTITLTGVTMVSAPTRSPSTIALRPCRQARGARVPVREDRGRLAVVCGSPHVGALARCAGRPRSP